MKPIALHIIDTLGRGGAEKLLVNVVNELGDSFDNIVLYFSAPHDLRSEIKNAKVICLDIPFSISNLSKIAKEISKVISNDNVSIIHSHSYWTNIAVRLARTKKTTFIQSYHNAIYDTMWKKPIIKILAFIDKITYRKNIKLIAVSDYVKQILEKKLKYKNISVLKNFIEDPDLIHTERLNYKLGSTLKVISIGNIKREKNYEMIIESFDKFLKNSNIQFDVYGGGNNLNKFIKDVEDKEIEGLRFLGPTSNVYQEMIKYDLFCMASFSEAFGLSILEAMKAKLPMLLSDIPAFKEIAEDSAIYFKSNNIEDFSNKITDITEGKISINFDKSLYSDILRQYSKEIYINKLSSLYLELINEN